MQKRKEKKKMKKKKKEKKEKMKNKKKRVFSVQRGCELRTASSGEWVPNYLFHWNL